MGLASAALLTPSTLPRQPQPKLTPLESRLHKLTSTSSFARARRASRRSLSLRANPLRRGGEVMASPSWPSPSSEQGSRGGGARSAWDEKPYELLPGGRRAYLDEEDVVSFLDPPKELIPIDPASYNPAAYLWKKIGDIHEDRRHRLLYKLKARHISKLWEITGARYQDAKLSVQSSSTLLSLQDKSRRVEFWTCQTKQGPLPISWMNDFKKVIFCGKDGETYGRILLGGMIPAGLASYYSPLYFTIKQVVEVMPTEQPCDLAYEFGNGLLDLDEFPEGFPKPAEHPWPFNDHLVIYIRHAGPGVLVGQAWQEGKELEQVPKKFCGEILMVKDFAVSES